MMIPYGRHEITQQDIDSVVEVLKSDFLTQGPKVPLFEKKVAKKVGAKHALAVNSATSALHIACLALGLDSGDYLWTSPITFVASANCGLYCGAKIDFVDIDPCTYNLCPKALEKKLVEAKRYDKLPKILVVVHLTGQPCEMASIHALAQRFGFKIIEDASHAIGGKYQSQYIGNCRFSDITIFSFHPVKIITTGEGGMALTNNDSLAEKMNLFRSHGITRDQNLMTHEIDGPWYYQQVELGFNYRMTELQAALGLTQIDRLDIYVAARHEMAIRYKEKLQGLPIVFPFQQQDSYSAFHLFVIRLQIDKVKISHKDLFEQLRARNIGVNLHYIPVHLHPFYENLGFKYGDFPEAEKYYSTAISIPLFYGLTCNQQDFVVESLIHLLGPK
jgi:UDP-4-amino-4,6-dideoxy-N-acetyl-beta-L-altrosamine transaminase